MTEIVIEEFKPVTRNPLRGFARVRMPSGMIFHDIGLYQKGTERWASPPGKPILGRDGTHITRDGKPAYQAMVSFASKEARDKFSSAIVSAVNASHPQAFE